METGSVDGVSSTPIPFENPYQMKALNAITNFNSKAKELDTKYGRSSPEFKTFLDNEYINAYMYIQIQQGASSPSYNSNSDVIKLSTAYKDIMGSYSYPPAVDTHQITTMIELGTYDAQMNHSIKGYFPDDFNTSMDNLNQSTAG